MSNGYTQEAAAPSLDTWGKVGMLVENQPTALLSRGASKQDNLKRALMAGLSLKFQRRGTIMNKLSGLQTVAKESKGQKEEPIVKLVGPDKSAEDLVALTREADLRHKLLVEERLRRAEVENREKRMRELQSRDGSQEVQRKLQSLRIKEHENVFEHLHAHGQGLTFNS